MSDIILSICIAGRNDNYGYNFKYRFVQSMNYFAWSAKQAGISDQIEIVFADWNSDIALASEIILSEDAAKLVRFIETPPAIAKKYNPSFSPFNQSAAFNTAFRRAKGKFIGLMPGDILFTSWSLRNLLLLLTQKNVSELDLQSVMLAIPRKNIPFQYNESLYFTAPEDIEKILLSGDAFMKTDNDVRGMMGGYGAFFLPRETIYNLRGVDERIAGWGYNDIDLALRCADQIKVINTSGFGICCYDFEASPKMSKQKKERETSFQPIELGFAHNSELWGLADDTLQEQRCTHFSNKNDYQYTPSRPPSLSLQEWVAILLSSYPIDLVKNISELALTAVSLSLTAKIKNISVFGMDDHSIIVALGLLNGFPYITVHEKILTRNQFYRLWDNDKKYAAIHYLGHIRYVPSMKFTADEKPELLLFDSAWISAEKIIEQCSKTSILLFSPKCGISKEDIEKIALNFKFNIFQTNHIVILSSFEIPSEMQMKAIHGNFIKSFCASSRITALCRRTGILLSLLSLYPIFHWINILQKFRKFKNGISE